MRLLESQIAHCRAASFDYAAKRPLLRSELALNAVKGCFDSVQEVVLSQARSAARRFSCPSCFAIFVYLRGFVFLVLLALAAPSLASAVSSQTTATLTLPAVVIPPNAETTLAITLRQKGNVQAADLTLTYDPTVADLLAAASDWSMAFNEQPSDVITIALATATPPAGDVTLARLTFRALGVKGQSTALVFQRALLNEGQVAVAAQAGQIAVDTTPVTDLRAGRAGGGVRLEWSSVGSDAQHYEVWRADNAPFFTPPAGGVRIAHDLPPGSLGWTDTNGGLGNVGVNSFYVVLAVDAGGRASPASNRVGEFDFGLRPGQ